MGKPSIAIVGAGPTGLTLARLLQVSEVDMAVTIFELDSSPTSRKFQGGTLDLHPETGLAALKKAGLWDQAFPFLRYEGEEMVIADKNATELVHMSDAPQIEGSDARPEIDREKLKEILLGSVDGTKVRWGRRLKSVDAENGLLNFADGETAGPFDLIVGADGAYSKVRHVLTDVRPHYSGICGFEGHIHDPSANFPRVSKLVGRGSYFAAADCKLLTAQRMGDDSIKVGMWTKQPESYPSELAGDAPFDEEKLRDKLLKQYDDWAPEIKECVSACTRFRPWALYELPVGHTWSHRKGYTLIGDAAHLCTPFAGRGVNAGMKDALDLAELIVESQQRETTLNLDDAVEKFEQVMFPQARKVQEDTMRNKIPMFQEDAPIGFMVAMIGVVGEETGWSLDKGFLAWVPIRKMAYSFFWIQTTFGLLRRKIRYLFSRW